MEFNPSHATHLHLSVRLTHSNPSEKEYSAGNITKGKDRIEKERICGRQWQHRHLTPGANPILRITREKRVANVAVWQVVERYSPAKNSYKLPRQELNIELSIAAERKLEILDEEGFRSYCLERKLSEKTIQTHVKIVKEFETFLRTKCENRSIANATSANLHTFVKHLVEENRNTWDNLLSLVRYARFINNKEIIVPLLELLDGSDVLENLSDTIKQTVGSTKHKAIFEGIKLPPLGTLPKDKPKITKKFMDNLEAELGVGKCREILSSGPHAGPKEQYLPEQKKFLESKGIDDFLRRKHEEYVEELEKHMKERTLYFTQEITKEVLDYVRKTPTCQVGVRKGDKIYVTKIPYMAKEYLREKDPKKKRYYACHCAWVREAIKSDLKISPNFCYCSAGFEKRLWDVIFGQDVKADVLQTVLKGDPICKFAIHVPKEYIGQEACSKELRARK